MVKGRRASSRRRKYGNWTKSGSKKGKCGLCIATTKDGRKCGNWASCRKECNGYCWMHAPKYANTNYRRGKGCHPPSSSPKFHRSSSKSRSSSRSYDDMPMPIPSMPSRSSSSFAGDDAQKNLEKLLRLLSRRGVASKSDGWTVAQIRAASGLSGNRWKAVQLRGKPDRRKKNGKSKALGRGKRGKTMVYWVRNI